MDYALGVILGLILTTIGWNLRETYTAHGCIKRIEQKLADHLGVK